MSFGLSFRAEAKAGDIPSFFLAEAGFAAVRLTLGQTQAVIGRGRGH